ncbi:hypothetical protein B5S31_g3157 [[Candida] boidinii]|nr:hypothetical protein B5S31_g3157 [[Candida] boidinii]
MIWLTYFLTILVSVNAFGFDSSKEYRQREKNKQQIILSGKAYNLNANNLHLVDQSEENEKRYEGKILRQLEKKDYSIDKEDIKNDNNVIEAALANTDEASMASMWNLINFDISDCEHLVAQPSRKESQVQEEVPISEHLFEETTGTNDDTSGCIEVDDFDDFKLDDLISKNDKASGNLVEDLNQANKTPENENDKPQKQKANARTSRQSGAKLHSKSKHHLSKEMETSADKNQDFPDQSQPTIKESLDNRKKMWWSNTDVPYDFIESTINRGKDEILNFFANSTESDFLRFAKELSNELSCTTRETSKASVKKLELFISGIKSFLESQVVDNKLDIFEKSDYIVKSFADMGSDTDDNEYVEISESSPLKVLEKLENAITRINKVSEFLNQNKNSTVDGEIDENVFDQIFLSDNEYSFSDEDDGYYEKDYENDENDLIGEDSDFFDDDFDDDLNTEDDSDNESGFSNDEYETRVNNSEKTHQKYWNDTFHEHLYRNRSNAVFESQFFPSLLLATFVCITFLYPLF